MRKRLIAGNWKMHGSLSQAENLLNGIKQGLSAIGSSQIDVAVLPPFVYLALTQKSLANSPVQWGAQNLYLGAQGAFTGEVAGPMLKELGCHYVLVGHSERRTIFQEGSSLVAAKVKAALIAGLIPILCVGETREQRERNETENVIREQIESVIQANSINAFHNIVIAYEPVWAIGTGLTATPEQAQQVHAFIRKLIAQNNVDLGSAIRILYGGSMKPDNAAALLSMPDIDGGLIGGASLEVASFLAICAAKQDKSVLSS